MLSEVPAFPILLSRDLAESKVFYGDVLGLPLAVETEDRVVFKAGGGTQVILSKSTVGTSDTQSQLVWMVPDIHAAVADLRRRGVRIEEYSAPDPVTVDGVADMGDRWAAWFVDPHRNVLAVVQRKG